ncbi:Calx-beta domain-containing protein [Anabaena sp. FACHB-1250]|uniref:beta strand repeat-containing protein n=1 Tax=Anabaena sp. FACHB-1250 TaxID=2692770 RepID=UPI001F5509BA|nr:Calx-beta domain-containing protein [Anabaena sp. FACHB-1250]
MTLPNITLTVSPTNVLEDGTTNLVYTFTRTGITTNALNVNYGITGTADSSDYTGATPGTGKTITFAAGASTATLTINPTVDTLIESDETVTLTLLPVSGTIANTISESASGGFGTTEKLYYISSTGGSFSLNYQMYGIPDQAEIFVNNVLTTRTNGFVSGSGSLNLNSVTLQTGDQVKVVITGNNPGTAWDYNVYYSGGIVPTTYTVGTTGAVTGTILDDDATITLAVSPTSVLEDGTTNLVYTFTRTGITTNVLTANYSINGTADSSDYTGATPGTGKTITFAAGASTATLTIDPTADTTIESNETVALTLVAGTGYTVGTTEAVTGTIANDDPTITLRVDPATVTEDGTDNLVYTFTRTGDTTNALTVNYSITGTADSSDYTGATPGTGKTITFAAGETTKQITIDPTADTSVESNETVALTLTAGTDYTIGTTTAVTGIIRNDHPVISFSSPTFRVNENGDYISAVTIIRTGNIDGVDSVTVTPTNGTATAPGDFNSNPIIVNFANGETSKTIRIPIVNVTDVESTETVNLTLSNPSRGATLGSQQTAEMTIVDNDGSFGYSWGDPHMKTLDGIYYEFQSVGFFTLLKSTTDDFEIQARQESWIYNPNVSVNTAVAIKIGGNRFQLDLSANPLKIDGIATNLPNGQYQLIGNNNIVRSNNTYTIYSENGDQIQVALNGNHINVFAYPASNRQGNLVGLLGNYNGNPNDDFALRNGTVIGGQPDYNRIYGDYDDSWGVTQADSLFIEPITTAPVSPTTVITINTLTPQERTAAETIARNAGITDPTLLDAAILDIHVTNGDNTFIQGHTNLQQQLNINITGVADTLIGGTGDDSYYVDNTADTITELVGQGTDSVFSTVTYTLSANVENLTLQGTTAINGTGNELNNIITGNTGNNVLTGSAGNDTLIGGAGNDTLIGGDGVDTVDYGQLATNITLHITLQAQGVVNKGALGTDTVQAEAFLGNADFANVIDTATSNAINADLGSNSLTVLGLPSGDVTFTVVNFQNVTGSQADDIITGNNLNNNLNGGAGDDILFASAGNDTLIGGDGVDIVDYGQLATNITLDITLQAQGIVNKGALGTDTVQAEAFLGNADFANVIDAATSNSINVDLGQNSLTVLGLPSGDVTFTVVNFQNVTGSQANDIITGNDLNNILNGGTGADTLIGGLGNDSYYVDNTADIIIENLNEGTDTVFSIIDYTLGDNLENLTLQGTTAINGTGNTLNNSITGNAADNVLTGGLGNDTFIGGLGNDTLIGGLGNDSYYVDNTADIIIENLNEGTDRVFSIIDYTLGDNLENLTLQGTTAINGTGNTLNNSITGNAADNVLTGGTGADTLIGGAGNDSYYVDNTADIVTENLNEGTDTVFTTISYTLSANVENLTLQGTTAINGTGNSLNNILTGNSAVNTINGGIGNDTLNGGIGNDILLGGVGADDLTGSIGNDFIYLGANDNAVDTVRYTAGDGIDMIYQFVRGVGGDKIDFSGITNIDVVTSGINTRFAVGDGISGNTGFGTGQLLGTLSSTNGFTSDSVNVNLFGGNFLFS